MFQDNVIVITGGADGIGKCIADEFRKDGAKVCVIDYAKGDHYVGDIADKQVLEDFAQQVIQKYGRIDNQYTIYEGPDALQQPVGKVGNPIDIAIFGIR